MELINKIRKSRKGFTLVEIIVVLVILAILAAFLIPSMLGFVDEANKKAAIAQQREVYIAAQAVATEYGLTAGTNLSSSAALDAANTTAAKARMKSYLKDDITPGAGAKGDKTASWTVTVDSKGRVTAVTFTTNGQVLDTLSPAVAS